MPTVGSDKKTFRLGAEDIELRDGVCVTGAGKLAGSNLDMISAVRNAALFTGIDRYEALRMASAYPSNALRLEGQLGYIRPGYRASFIELDDELNLYRSWIDGEVNE